MTMTRLILRSLWHHRTRQAGVVLASAVTCAVLVGAFVVGDSVRHTLSLRAAARLGSVEVVVDAADRTCRAALAEEMAEALGHATAAVLRTDAVAATPDGSARAARTQLLGVSEAFWTMAAQRMPPPAPGKVYLNETLARQLDAGVGETIIFRVPRPTALPRDVPLGSDGDLFAVLRLEVAAVLGSEQFGRFAIQSEATPPRNAFIARDELARHLQREGQANLLLIGGAVVPGGTALDPVRVVKALRSQWQLADLQLRLARVGPRETWELSSDRVFLEQAVIDAARSFDPAATGILTYFVNRLIHGGRRTPYSMVTAISPAPFGERRGHGEVSTRVTEGIVLNAWAAEDLEAAEGDTVSLHYFALGGDRRLEERQATFSVAGIVPMEGVAADRSLAPRLPGLSDAEHCRQWNPGIAIDLSTIRDKDEAYWEAYRGTPKAFLSLSAGQALWANPYGKLTAIRFDGEEVIVGDLAGHLLATLDPSAVLRVDAVRGDDGAASAPTVDFAHLFLGMSLFIIVSALMLTGFQFALATDARRGEMGLLLATGFTRLQIFRLRALEGLALSAVGAVVGLPLGVLYPFSVVAALNTIWRGASGGLPIQFHVTPTALVAGAAAAALAGGCVTWLVVWRRASRPPRALLDRLGPEMLRGEGGVAGRRVGVAAACLAYAGTAVVVAGSGRGVVGAGVFFVAGFLTLVGNLLVVMVLLIRPASVTAATSLRWRGLAWRRLGRQPWRAQATIVMIATGAFLLVGINNARLSPTTGADDRGSGTGGFALWARSTVPIVTDLNDGDARAELGIDAGLPAAGFSVVSLRVRDGDDASCLNLDAPRRPRVLGVDVDALSRRAAFSITAVSPSLAPDKGWHLLRAEAAADVVPGIVDASTLQWALKKRLGDTIAYRDAQGKPFTVRLVATIADSILQGNVLIDRAQFASRFNDEAGSRAFLIDAPPAVASNVSAALTRGLADFGFETVPTTTRLAMLFEVQNTYLTIFQVLGAIGMVLGCGGLAALVWRNIAERRGELATMIAMGFTLNRLRRLVLAEHAMLLAAGLLAGSLAAVVALIPAWRTPGTQIPWGTVTTTLIAVTACGLGAAILAVQVTLRGSLVEAMRAD